MIIINLKKIILYYLYSIISLTILERMIFGNIKGGIHPGILIHVFVLLLLIIDFFRSKIEYNKIFYMIFGFSIVYIFNLYTVEIVHFLNLSLIPSISYTLKIYLLLFLSYYIYKNASYYYAYLDKILLINSIVVLLNIILGYTFKLGWKSYGKIENTYRGYLAGNDTSILAFMVFGYALFSFFDTNNKRKRKLYGTILILSLYAMYIIATKAFFVAGIILFLYNIRKGFNKKALFLGIFILIISALLLTNEDIQQRFLTNYLTQMRKSEKIIENTQVLPESLMWLNTVAPGRIVIGLSLMFSLFQNSILNILFGYGVVGIYEAFGRPPMMHFFSQFGHYGVLGWFSFYFPQLLLAIKVIVKKQITMITTLFFAIFLYGSLGGFLYGYAATSAVYALFFSLSLYQIKHKRFL